MKFYPLASLYLSFAVIVLFAVSSLLRITSDEFSCLIIVTFVDVFWGAQPPEVYLQKIFFLQQNYPLIFGAFNGFVAPALKISITAMMIYGAFFYLYRAWKTLSEEAFH